jgi:plasmid stabilization system protein ParE
MYNVDISDQAEQDLTSIIAYIAEKLFAPKAASDFADKVYDCYDRLAENPFIYEQCRDPKLQREGYRRAVINNYILVYKIYEETNEVVVCRFFYGRQDYANQI